VASSGWSHAFLTEKTHFLYPDTPSDVFSMTPCRAGDYGFWRDYPAAAMRIAAAGGLELDVPGRRPAGIGAQATETEFIDTWIFIREVLPGSHLPAR